jgi:hypothetical protein
LSNIASIFGFYLVETERQTFLKISNFSIYSLVHEHVPDENPLTPIQAQAVQRVIRHFSHPISAADICRQFAEAKNAANVAREQQIGHILATILTLVLLWKTAEVLFVRQRVCLT